MSDVIEGVTTAGEENNDSTEVEPEAFTVHGQPAVPDGDVVVVFPSREQLVEVVNQLRNDGFWQCLDLCAVDFLTHPSRPALANGVIAERFEIVVLLINHTARTRIRVRVQIPESDPTCPTLFRLHPGTEAMEREAYDLFGVVFDGHPDMTRILLPDDWEGHPLRKDYAIGRIPVQFKNSIAQG